MTFFDAAILNDVKLGQCFMFGKTAQITGVFWKYVNRDVTETYLS